MSWTHLEDTTPKARKEHRCYLCELPIRKGTIHVARSGVGDNGIEKFRMHAECEKITKPWIEQDWENHDAWDFREALKKLQQPTLNNQKENKL